MILDTGSSDGTQGIIRKACKKLKLPLELYEEPFVDFAATRNRVLQLASNKTEFVLMLSGDETLENAEHLRTFVQLHSGFCGSTEELFNLRVFMGPEQWYWSERLLKADNHAVPSGAFLGLNSGGLKCARIRGWINPEVSVCAAGGSFRRLLSTTSLAARVNLHR